jgi:hypothetical protein
MVFSTTEWPEFNPVEQVTVVKKVTEAKRIEQEEILMKITNWGVTLYQSFERYILLPQSRSGPHCLGIVAEGLYREGFVRYSGQYPGYAGDTVDSMLLP